MGGGGGGAMVQPSPPSNRAPSTAGTNTITLDEDSTDFGLEIAAPTDADGDSLTITVTGLPTGGTLTTADGTEVTNGMTLTISQLTGLTFTPDANLNDDNTDFGSFSYSVSDGTTSTSGTVNISVTPVNDAPEFTSGPDLNIEENRTEINGFTATDIDGDTLAYSISGGEDQSFFTIDPDTGALTFIDRLDFENAQDSDANNIYVVEITIDDGNGGSATQTFNIIVTDVVTGITISNSSIDENISGEVVGDLTAAIDDINATHEYSYSLSGEDADKFEVVDGQLKLKDSVTGVFATKSSYSITVTSTDSAGAAISVDYNVEVNATPTDISLSSYSVNESSYGLSVGTITATDPNTDDEFTYSITGGADQDYFEIDSSGVSQEGAFTVTIDGFDISNDKLTLVIVGGSSNLTTQEFDALSGVEVTSDGLSGTQIFFAPDSSGQSGGLTLSGVEESFDDTWTATTYTVEIIADSNLG